MDMLRKGKEGRLCKLNAALTFREFLDDYASEETKNAVVGHSPLASAIH
jgi:2-iminoacetate synthase